MSTGKGAGARLHADTPCPIRAHQRLPASPKTPAVIALRSTGTWGELGAASKPGSWGSLVGAGFSPHTYQHMQTG